jgi:glycerophosphoryl diester phosphodiesterase
MALLRHLAITAAAIVATASAAPSAQAVDLHAHRGGGLTDGKPAAYENSLSAFKTAPGRGAAVVELDVHVSNDGVPFVMHDGTLDRTTDCGGAVADHSAAEVDACHIDRLGTTDVFTEVPGSTEPVPRLAAVLSWAKDAGARLNIEINNYPTDPSYDPGSGFVNAELDAIDASGIPKSQVLMQSFLPANLDPAKQRGYRTALITFEGGNPQALSLAKQGGYDVLEPQWPVKDAGRFVKQAHAAKRQVVPWTIDKRTEVTAAAAAGVDGVITDDLPVARAGLKCFGADKAYKAAQRKLKAAKAALKHAKTPAAKKQAAARVKAAKKKRDKAKRARHRACA